MKLQYVTIENFRSIKHMEFRFPKSGILVLVGANNAGKSNIIRAIDNMCGDQWFNADKAEDHDHYLRDKDNAIRIKLSFDDTRYCEWSSDGDRRYPTLYEHDEPLYREQPKVAFPCIYLAADRTFERQMSFYDGTLLGKIRHAFHHRASPVREKLKEKFEEIVAVFDEVRGFTDFKADFATFFAEMQADTSAQLNIDFKPYTPSNYFKTMQVVAEDPAAGNEKMSLDELGEGTRNMVLLALLRSYAKNFREANKERGGLVALEEPELYMHPQARRHLAKVLRELATSGMQVIISTHSSSFIDTEFFDSVGRVVKVDDEDNPGRQHTEMRWVSKKRLVERCEATGVPKGKATVDSIGEFYKATSNPMLNEAFFARFVILVEGDTEELVLPVFLGQAGFDCDLLGISIISVRGKPQIPKYWRLFGAFEIPMLVIADNDVGKKGASNAPLAACFGLPVDEFDDVDVCKLITPNRTPKSPILMLEGDYETALRKEFLATGGGAGDQLDEWEKEAIDLIKPLKGQSKGQVARFIARKMCQETDFVPGFVGEITSVLMAAGFKSKNATTEEVDQPEWVAADDEEPWDYDPDDIPF